MDQIKIGKFIATLRKEKNMTQLDLATKLGVTDRAVSKWENGRGLPDPSLITLLCDELCISTDEFFNGEQITKNKTFNPTEDNIVITPCEQKEKPKTLLLKIKSFFKALNKKWIFIIGAISLAVIFVLMTVVLLSNPKDDSVSYCNVYFDSRGGSEIKEQKIEKGKTVNEPDTPQKTGFNFVYWELNGKKYDFNLSVNSDLTLSAKWKSDGTTETFVVSFFTNGGSEVESFEVAKGSSFTKPTNPTKDGFEFNGWYYMGTPYDFDTKVTENITLVALWTANTNNTHQESNNHSSNNTDTSNQDPINAISYTEAKFSQVKDKKWYLNGYSNVYLHFYIETNDLGTYNRVDTYNCDLSLNSGFTVKNYYDGGLGENIAFANADVIPVPDYYWKFYLDDNILILHNTQTNEFYQFTASPQKNAKALQQLTFNDVKGKWYIKGSNTSYIDFVDANKYPGDTDICNIKATNIDLEKMVQSKTNMNSGRGSIRSHCFIYDIKITNGELTMTNIINDDSGTLTFVREPAYVPIAEFTLDKTQITRSISDKSELYLYSQLTPHYATNSEIVWSSSNTDVISIFSTDRATYDESKNGKIRCDLSVISPGVTIITAETSDGKHFASCVITILPVNATGISIDPAYAIVEKGKELQLTATVVPDNATNKNVVWESNDSTVATVSSKGVVKGVSTGSAMITAKTSDGTAVAVCTIVVANPKLSASSSVAISTSVSGSSITSGVKATVNATGGTGIYKYSIKFYYNNTLIGETTNSDNNFIFVPQRANGNYKVIATVTDSAGEITTTESLTTITIS